MGGEVKNLNTNVKIRGKGIKPCKKTKGDFALRHIGVNVGGKVVVS